MTPAELSTLLDEANHHPWESVRSALARVEGQPHPRIGWLTSHLAETKRQYWAAIAEATGAPTPPDDLGLTRLMEWEVEAARQLAPGLLARPVHYGQDELNWTVESLLRFNARHTAWHAGQIGALTRQPRLA